MCYLVQIQSKSKSPVQIPPIQKSLTGTDLRSALEKVFFKQAENASRLCFNASSNGNESFNIMVASEARKLCRYFKSESFDFRLASDVCRKMRAEILCKLQMKPLAYHLAK